VFQIAWSDKDSNESDFENEEVATYVFTTNAVIGKEEEEEEEEKEEEESFTQVFIHFLYLSKEDLAEVIAGELPCENDYIYQIRF